LLFIVDSLESTSAASLQTSLRWWRIPPQFSYFSLLEVGNWS
jgi:hypothetical protein